MTPCMGWMEGVLENPCCLLSLIRRALRYRRQRTHTGISLQNRAQEHPKISPFPYIPYFQQLSRLAPTSIRAFSKTLLLVSTTDVVLHFKGSASLQKFFYCQEIWPTNNRLELGFFFSRKHILFAQIFFLRKQSRCIL